MVESLLQKTRRLGHAHTGPLSEYGALVAISALVGVAVGLAAALLHKAIHVTTFVFFGLGGQLLSSLGSYYVVIVPVVGAVVVQLLTLTSPRVAKRKGVAAVIRAIVRKGGWIDLRTTLFHFVAPVLVIGSGGTVGPEGPAAQVGGGVASLLTQTLRLSERKIRLFTAAGAGAAIAAVFNAPIGGVFFALEVVLMNDLQTATLSAVILASVASSVVARSILGNLHPFFVPAFALGQPLYFIGYAILGVLAGAWSAAFVWFYRETHRVLERGRLPVPRWLQLPLVGLLLGIVGYFFPGIFGIGYGTINLALVGKLSVLTMAVLLVGKFVFVPLILASGGYGGVFAPAIFQGAMLGSLVATASNHLLGIHLDPVTYSLVGMGSVLGGVNAIPLAAILILFEMTNNYAFILPLMTGVVISHLVARALIGATPHHLHLEKYGVFIQLGREVNILRSLHVRDVFRPETNTVPARAKLSQLLEHVLDSPFSSVFVVDDDQRLVGVIGQNELRHALVNYEELKDIVTAADLATSDFETVRMDDDLHFVMQQFAHTQYEELPVVSDVDPRRVIGVITHKDVVDAYNRAVARHEMAEGILDSLKLAERGARAQLTEGYALEEIPAPPAFWGKTLRELNLRAAYGLEVLMISRASGPNGQRQRLVPRPDMVIQEDDVLLVLGRNEDIEHVRRMTV